MRASTRARLLQAYKDGLPGICSCCAMLPSVICALDRAGAADLEVDHDASRRDAVDGMPARGRM
jgi:hypothetical protein